MLSFGRETCTQNGLRGVLKSARLRPLRPLRRCAVVPAARACGSGPWHRPFALELHTRRVKVQ